MSSVSPVLIALECVDVPTLSPVSPMEKMLYTFHRGQPVPLSQREFWRVERGIVQLHNDSTQANITVLGWLQQGNLWGPFLTRLENIQAIAFTDCYLQRYSAAEIQNSATLQQDLQQQSLHRLHQTEYLLAIAGLKRIEDRLIALLLLLKQDMGQDCGEMIRLRCRFTHQNLADTIGTTRVTITRLFKEFQQQQWFQLDGDRHILINKNFQSNCLL